MSYFPARLFFKLPFFIVLSYLLSLCRPLFSQDEVDLINPGINPSSLPRPGFLPCKLNLEDTPEWHDKPQMKEVERQVITPGMFQFISGTGGHLPGMTGSPDIDDLFSKWIKKLSQKSDRKPGQPFNQTEASLDFKQPALLAFDPADEGWQVVLTIDEHGHLNASEQAEDKEEISANLEWEDLGAIWRNNKNELHTTSAEYITEDFGDDSRVLAYLDTIGTNHLYCRTLADGTRIYVYRALDGKVHEVTAEDIKKSQRITYEYEMAKVSGQGLAAGGRVNYEGELVPILPAEPDRSERDKGILDSDKEGKQAGKTQSKRKKNHGGKPYPDRKPAEHRTEEVAQAGIGGEACHSKEATQPADIVNQEQTQQDIRNPSAPLTTSYPWYDDKWRFYSRDLTNIQIAQNGSLAAKIQQGRIKIYIERHDKQWDSFKIDISASCFSLNKDGSKIAAADGNKVTVWHRNESSGKWIQSTTHSANDSIEDVRFSPNEGHLILTKVDKYVEVVNLNHYGCLHAQPVDFLIIDEQGSFMILSREGRIKSFEMGAKKNAPNQPTIILDCDIQSLHLSPDAKTLVAPNEKNIWVGEIDDKKIVATPTQNLPRHNYRVTDVTFDDNTTTIVGYLKGTVRLWRCPRTGGTRSDVKLYDFNLTEMDNRTIKNAFHIPSEDLVATLLSDGSMIMWKYNTEGKKSYYQQQQPDTPNFGEVRHYNGAEHYFLVKDSIGYAIIRRWHKQ